MEVEIVKQSIKEGVSASSGKPYCIKSLFVKTYDENVYNAIVENLKEQGAPEEKIAKFCSPNEYNGKTSYAFWLNCSNYTFDKVEKFGILEAAILFTYENDFVKAKIEVIDKKEQVKKYTPPQNYESVSGWENEGEVVNHAPAEPALDLPISDGSDDLPF